MHSRFIVTRGQPFQPFAARALAHLDIIHVRVGVLPVARVGEVLDGPAGETFAQCLQRAWHSEAVATAQAKAGHATGGRGGLGLTPPCPGQADGVGCALGRRVEQRW